MKKNIESGLIIPVVVILSIILNLKSFLYQSNLSLFEYLVSIVYLVIWVYIFSIGIINKKSSLIFFSTIFWIMTFLTSAVSLYVIITDILFSENILFLIVFITPLSGFDFMFDDNYMLFVLTLIISCCYSYFGVKFLTTQRKKKI